MPLTNTLFPDAQNSWDFDHPFPNSCDEKTCPGIDCLAAMARKLHSELKVHNEQ